MIQKRIMVFLFSSLFITSLATAANRNDLRRYQPEEPVDSIENSQGEDPLISKGWYFSSMGMQKAWQITTGNPSVVVATVDSGIDYNNPELFSAIVRHPQEKEPNGIDDDGNGYVDDYIGWNYCNNVPLPWDDNGHGTMVAGIIAGALDNGIGGAGICPNCSILPLRFISSRGSGDNKDAIDAIYYAISNHVRVINLSFADDSPDSNLQNIIELAGQADIVVVIAAGNYGSDNDVKPMYPANYKGDHVLTVAAIEPSGKIWSQSNYGVNSVDLAAPGVDIYGPWRNQRWEKSNGTSFSAPIVAGTAGLILSANPNLTAPQVVQIILNTSRRNGYLDNYVSSGGTVDVAAAVQCAASANLDCLR